MGQTVTCSSPNTPYSFNLQHNDSGFLSQLLTLNSSSYRNPASSHHDSGICSSPHPTALSSTIQCQKHFLMPLDSCIEQMCTEFLPCTKYSNGKCLSPSHCNRKFYLACLLVKSQLTHRFKSLHTLGAKQRVAILHN